MNRPELRFARGDRVELPKRLGASRGVVVHAWRRTDTGAETCVVARVVSGRQRHTVVPEDELYRIEAR